jgi:hypothetical protein
MSRSTNGRSRFWSGGYVFYLHDKAVPARLDALEKRVDEVRKRLALEL